MISYARTYLTSAPLPSHVFPSSNESPRLSFNAIGYRRLCPVKLSSDYGCYGAHVLASIHKVELPIKDLYLRYFIRLMLKCIIPEKGLRNLDCKTYLVVMAPYSSANGLPILMLVILPRQLMSLPTELLTLLQLLFSELLQC